VSEDMYHRD